MINFEKMTLKNFMSFGDTPTTVILNRSHSTLITGKNGHGKSAVIEALSFVLFNKSFRGINKPALVNTINQKGLHVEISFNDGKDAYAVARGIKPNVFEIRKNGEMLDQDADQKDQQAKLEEIIGFTFNEFIKTVALGHANFKPFMQLTTPERRQFVDSVLNLEVYTRMAKRHKDYVFALTNKKKDIQSAISSVERVIQSSVSALVTIRETSARLVETTEEAFRGATERAKELAAEVSGLTNMDDQVATVEAERKKVQDAINTVRTSINALKQEESSRRSEATRIAAQIAKIDDSGKCYACGGPVDASNAAKHKAELVESMEAVKATFGSGQAQIEKYESALVRGEAKLQEINEQLAALKTTWNNGERTKARFEAAKTELMAAKKAVEAAKEKAGSDTTKYEKAIADGKEEMSGYEEELKKIEETSRVYDAVSELLKDSGIKAQLIDRYIPLLNKYANKHLETMNAPFRIEVDREFNDRIVGRYKDEFTYVSLSQGERCRVDLAMLFAWLQVATDASGVGTNILFLDEIGASELDADGVESMFDILGDVCETKNVFIISHRDDIAQRCRSVMSIEKRNGFSTVI